MPATHDCEFGFKQQQVSRDRRVVLPSAFAFENCLTVSAGDYRAALAIAVDIGSLGDKIRLILLLKALDDATEYGKNHSSWSTPGPCASFATSIRPRNGEVARLFRQEDNIISTRRYDKPFFVLSLLISNSRDLLQCNSVSSDSSV